jgi:hypothetical protein
MREITVVAGRRDISDFGDPPVRAVLVERDEACAEEWLERMPNTHRYFGRSALDRNTLDSEHRRRARDDVKTDATDEQREGDGERSG